MNPAKLKHRIIFQEKAAHQVDDWGRPVADWVDKAKTRAEIIDVSGRAFFEAAAHQMEDVITLRIRYRPGIHKGMRIALGGQQYDILHIDNGGYKKDFLWLKARDVQAKGAASGGDIHDGGL